MSGFQSYKQNAEVLEKHAREEVDNASRQRREKAAEITLEFVKLRLEHGGIMPDFDEFLKMQEKQKRQLRPHGELEKAAPAHQERDAVQEGRE